MSRQFLYLSSAEAQLTLGFGPARPTESLFFALRPPVAVAQAARSLAEALAAQRPKRSPGLDRAPACHAALSGPVRRPAAFIAGAGATRGGEPARRAVPAGIRSCWPALAGKVATCRQWHWATAPASPACMPCIARWPMHWCVSNCRATRASPRIITLLYDRDAVAEQVLATPLAWQADALWLLRSVRGEPRYREGGCWPLHA